MTYRTGVIGTGFGAKVHVPVLQSHDAYDVLGVASVHHARSATVARDLGVGKAFDDWRKLVDCDDIDVVVIASNPVYHMDMTLRALSAGKHVLCEKPPALHASQVQAMHAAAQSASLVASMNFEWRFLPERTKIRDVLRRGTVGRVLHVNWRESWPTWPAIGAQTNSWFWQTSEGGGYLGAVGSHMIDALHHWFGPMQWVQGHVQTHVHARRGRTALEPCDADDAFHFHGQHADGSTCTVQLLTASVGLPPSLEIYGTEGTLVFNGSELSLAAPDTKTFNPVALEPRIDATAFDKSIQGYIHAQTRLYDAFAAALGGMVNEELPTFHDALYVQRVLDAIRKSSNETLPVSLL